MEETKTNPVMYLFVNKGLKMSTGKAIAQGAHAACEAVRISNPDMVKAWNEFGFYTKMIMEARDENHLATIQKYLEERNVNSIMIIDEGRTEIPKHSKTALGAEIVDKNTLGPIFQEFDLFKDKIKVSVEFERRK